MTFKIEQFKNDVFMHRMNVAKASQKKVARAISSSRGTVDYIEKQAKRITVDNFLGMCKWMGVSPEKYYKN